MPAEELVFAFHADRLYTFERTERRSCSVFGGPAPDTITGTPFGPKPLHTIACLGGWHIPALNEHHLVELPLLYGMYYSGCDMEYRVKSGRAIEVLRFTGEVLDDWPYRDYPPLLPYVPLRLSDRCERTTYGGFASRFTNMPEKQPADLVVAVPPPVTLGVSLWGDMGDWEGVTIVFECDFETKTVGVSNVCS